jgi:flagellum-specific ATP synthase
VLSLIDEQLSRLARSRPEFSPVPMGRIVSCDSTMIEVSGLNAPIGTLCRIAVGHGGEAPAAEVVGFRGGRSLMMMLGDTVRLQPGSLVRAEGHPGQVMVGSEFLGRAVDGTARPIDGGAPVAGSTPWPLGGVREGALERSSVARPFDCGVRAINALATLGEGQRMGIVAGSGVGKSMLLDMILRGCDADIMVVGLIGERAREVSDFVNRHMEDPARRKRTAVIAVPADHAANLRLRGAQLACSLAEYHRSTGKRVLLVLDSLTRVAHAAREIALSLGEPGAARGYPPSALATITKLIERAGNSAASGGTITGIYTVLADGDDHADPVVDTARAILDGHIVLSREIAQRGQYPAIDVPASLSRVMEAIADPAHRHHARRLRAMIAAHDANHDFLLMGAYRAGADPLLDAAVALHPAITAFLAQEAGESVSLDASRAALARLMDDAGQSASA